MYLGSAEYIDMARVDGGMLYAERYLSASIEYFMASMELTTCNTMNVIREIIDTYYLVILWHVNSFLRHDLEINNYTTVIAK
jgi:hypothetical protein